MRSVRKLESVRCPVLSGMSMLSGAVGNVMTLLIGKVADCERSGHSQWHNSCMLLAMLVLVMCRGKIYQKYLLLMCNCFLLLRCEIKVFTRNLKALNANKLFHNKVVIPFILKSL